MANQPTNIAAIAQLPTQPQGRLGLEGLASVVQQYFHEGLAPEGHMQQP